MDRPRFLEIIERANGIEDAIAELAPNVELVATAPALTSTEGATNAENFLQTNPDMKVIATIGGGGAAVGANEGVKSAGVSDYDSFGVFGIDATENEIQNVIDLLNGETVEKDQYMPINVIDGSNAQEYYDEMIGG